MISIVVCTYNRNEDLIECIKSVAAFYKGDYPIELLVVDNNSKDATAEVVRQFQSNYDWVTYTFEETQGLSHARNKGYKAAQYEWILYLDDDAKITANFFERVEFLTTETGFQCIGGLYIPWYKYGKPKWYRERFGSNRKKYTKLSVLPKNNYASGGIFLLKKSLLEEHQGFDTNLGMNGEKVAYGEEDDLQRRIRNAGGEIAYDPELVIEHLVPKYKMNHKWFLSSSYKMGKTYFQTKGYPHNILTGFVALAIFFCQSIVHFFINIFKLFRKDYFMENFIIDVFKKPLKWLGAFVASWTS